MTNQITYKNNSLDFLDSHDYFILDVWGVIHDGISAYDGVVENLIKLRKSRKEIYFLSNAPRRSSKVAQTLEKFGIVKELYNSIMTSGEATHNFLSKNQNNDFNQYGQNYYYIGPDKDKDLLDDLNYKSVTDASKADFAIVTGFDDEFSVEDEKMEDLKECIKNNLTLICVNPDLIVIRQSGQEMLCAGVIAAKYEEMGGRVVNFGKPHNDVYDEILSIANVSDIKRVVAIGDGIETDIKGANLRGIDSALIGGGILSNRLKIKHGQLPKKEDLTKICESYQIYPKFTIAQL